MDFYLANYHNTPPPVRVKNKHHRTTRMSHLVTTTMETLYDELMTTASRVVTAHETTTTKDPRYPICKETFCPEFFTQPRIISHGIIAGRIGIALLILLLGTKMEKDFMRIITNTMFIPLLIGDLFNSYIEIADYLSYFAESSEEKQKFHLEYIAWTSNITFVLFDYNHYNVFVLMPLMLYCCHIACMPNDRINAFPTKMVCLLLQVIPFFLSLHRYLEIEETGGLVLTLLGYLSRIFTIVSFVVLTFTIFWAVVPLSRDLPYEAANSTDMQIRDARSRLAWTLCYMIIPYLSFIPYQTRSILWIASLDGEDASDTIHKLITVCELLVFLSNYYRAAVMCVITMICLPPYRRAVPLLFCCCGCCPQIHVEPLPRKEHESTLMYRFADV